MIAPYRDQIALLKKVISKLVCKSYLSDETEIEVNTVDQYQGRDKDIILYSCTKTYSKDVDVQDNKVLFFMFKCWMLCGQYKFVLICFRKIRF